MFKPFGSKKPKLTPEAAVSEIDRCLNGHSLLVEIDRGVIEGRASQIQLDNEAQVASIRDQRAGKALRKSGFWGSRSAPSVEEFREIRERLVPSEPEKNNYNPRLRAV